MKIPRLNRIRRAFLRIPDILRRRRLSSWNPQDTTSLSGNASGVIVSLASYPQRFKVLPLVLKSLLTQSTLPDMIIVWLDCSQEELPADLVRFSRAGVTFRFVPPGFRSHKKWYFAFQEFPDAVIVTVDDDIAYPAQTLASLLAARKRFPESVCALRCHTILKTKTGIVAPYCRWPGPLNHRLPSHQLVATGFGGVAYPPHVFNANPYAFQKEAFLKIAPSADDLWLKAMELISGKTVFHVRSLLRFFDIPGSQQFALSLENCANGATGNDRAVAALRERFQDIPLFSEVFGTWRGNVKPMP